MNQSGLWSEGAVTCRAGKAPRLILDRLRFSLRWPFICGLLLALLSSACSDRQIRLSTPIYGFKPVKAEYNLGEGERFECRDTWAFSDGQRRLFIIYAKYERESGKKLGDFFRISHDGGASLSSERTLPSAFSTKREPSFAFTKDGLVAVYASGSETDPKNLFYIRSEDEGVTWTTPVNINDEQGSAHMSSGGWFSFVQPSESEVYCLWTDSRRGFPLTYFSASRDGGRTWSPNQAVEYDFREREQLLPQVVMGAGGRLLAFWQDGRDRQTLYDIRGSYSDDGGQHWSASQKINDDQESVWQTHPEAVARGKEIYLTFTDFREPGEEGDKDWNIYFTVSPDNGQTWKRNIRLNDAQAGVDDFQRLAIDERGTLYCVWRSGRESILGEVYFAYSTDGGQSWSHSIKVNEGNELLYRLGMRLVTTSGGKLLCRWQEGRPGREEFPLAWLEPQTSDLSPPASPMAEHRAPPALPAGEVLFADDFSSGSQARWQVTTGVWTVIDGALMGVEPGAIVPFSSFARFKEPESYLLRGRFKLDPAHHQMAYLYFRANPAARRYYVIGNGFRTGVCLSLKEDDSLPVYRGLGPFALDGRPLAQRRYSFRNNRWYEFTLVVRPERVDYFVDGHWMLSYKGRMELPPGSFGIGGWASAPTYFDDLVVYGQRSTTAP